MGNKGGRGEDIIQLREDWKQLCEQHIPQIKYAVLYPELKVLYAQANHLITDFIKFYQNSMRQDGVMDFNEILFKTETLLASNKEVREYFKRKFAYIFVDEFQDTDPVQARILFYLSEKIGQSANTWNKVKLQPGKIYVVGDPKQSIFRFRRADIEIYNQAMEKITSNNKKFLSTNYRSSPDIINWVNELFKDRMKKPADGNYQADYVSLKPYRKEKGSIIVVEPSGVTVDEKQTKDDAREMEAKLTAAWIQQCVNKNKYQYKDIMVLFKTKKNMQATVQYFESLDIPYEMVGAKSFFGRGEILDMANFLRALASPIDKVSIVAALKGPFFALSDKDLCVFHEAKGRFDYRIIPEEKSDDPTLNALLEMSLLHKKAVQANAGLFLQQMLEEKGILASYMAAYNGKQKVLNLIKAVELLKSMGNIPFQDAVADFCEKLDQNVEMADFLPRTGMSNAVQLMTIHKAKGLEQKVVYLADSTSNDIIANNVCIVNQNNRIIYHIHGTAIETPEYLEYK